MKRSRDLLWLVLILALVALLARLLWPAQPVTADALLARLCIYLDSLQDMQVEVATQWERPGRVERGDVWSLEMEDRQLRVDSRSRYHLECRVFDTDGKGTSGAMGTFGHGSDLREWVRLGDFPDFRQATGAFLGVPTKEDREHPGKEDGAIPYALGTLVQADTRTFLMIHVKRAEYRGMEGGLHHLEFFQDGLDWDLWMDDSARPLPRRLRLRWAGMADGKPGRILDVRYQWQVPR